MAIPAGQLVETKRLSLIFQDGPHPLSRLVADAEGMFFSLHLYFTGLPGPVLESLGDQYGAYKRTRKVYVVLYLCSSFSFSTP